MDYPKIKEDGENYQSEKKAKMKAAVVGIGVPATAVLDRYI